jgi:triosephosphate isomerase
MNKTGFEAEDFVFALLPQIAGEDIAEVVICAPFTTLTNVIDSSRGTRIKVAAQNMHGDASGAFTGEISAGMLRDLDVRAVVLGHSERRQYFNETDAALSKKIVVALENELEPILCVGELDAQREAGETEVILTEQVETALAFVPADKLGSVVIAYEPVWAIGTGKTATPQMAEDAHAFIKGLLDRPVLYGGSVKPENAAELLSQSSIDGALVGGASLEPDSFAAICRAAPTS